jgi:hypothetical protein
MVWHYDLGPVTDWGPYADAVVEVVRGIIPASTNVVEARVWGPTDQGQVVSVTRLIKDYNLAGTRPYTGGGVYRELAYYTSMFLGRNPATGRKRFLRKWIHPGQTLSTTNPDLSGPLVAAAERTVIKDWFEAAKNISFAGGSVPICAPNGDHLPLGTVATVGDRMHVRQLSQ